MTNVEYDNSNEPIVISKSIIDLCFNQTNGSDLIALYIFYYKTAKWQKTDKVRATQKYCKQKLGWGQGRITKAHEKLKLLGLIEDVIRRNEKGLITGFYVKIKFLWGDKKNVFQLEHDDENNSTEKKEKCSKPPFMDKPIKRELETYALSVNNIYASSVIKKKKELPNGNYGCSDSDLTVRTETAVDSEKTSQPENGHLVQVVDEKKKIEKSVNKVFQVFYDSINQMVNFANKGHRKAAEDLIKKYGEEEVVRLAQLAVSLHGRPYAPVITTPFELREKLTKLMDYLLKEKNNSKIGFVPADGGDSATPDLFGVTNVDDRDFVFVPRDTSGDMS